MIKEIHLCSKERDINDISNTQATMVADIKYLREGHNRLEGKIDKFIDSADKKYATKEEVSAIREHNKLQDKNIDSNTTKLWKLVEKVSYISGALYIILKLNGWA